MTCSSLRVALIAGLLTCSNVSASDSPDPDRVAAALDALQTSVNARDFSLLESQLDESFSYQGREPALSRVIMRQVVEGYPHDIAGISIVGVSAAGSNWSVSVTIEGPNGAEQRLIRLGADYRLLQADIADIRLSGHDEHPPAPADKPRTEPLPDVLQFPFRIQKGLIVVQAAINGVAGNFLVDTGAQATTVNTVHFKEEQLHTVEIDHGMPSGVGGAISNVRGVPDLQLAWGELEIDNARGLAFDLSHLEASLGIPVVGLIGFNILEQFEVYFDYEAGLLTLYRLDDDNKPLNAEGRGLPAVTFGFDMVAHIPVFPARISGQELRLGLDSGAAEAMLAEKWQEPMSGKYEFIRVAEMRGGDTAVRASTEVRFDAMTVNNVEYEDVLFRFNDILLASGGTPDMDGLLGYQFLSTRPTSINFRTRQLSIW